MRYNLRSRSRAGIAEPEAAASQGPTTREGNLDPRSPQEKALMNEYILKEILSHLSSKDWLECRRVNKVWNEVATGLFIPKAPTVTLGKADNSHSLDEFVETMSNSLKIPCRNLFVDFSERVPEENSIHPQKFLEEVASFVRQLSMNPDVNGAFPQVEPKEKVVEYPDLKTSGFQIKTHLRSSELHESRVDDIIGILKHAPKLKAICFSFDPEVKEETFFQVIEHVPWTQLQLLVLSRAMKDEDFKTMVELGGPNLKLRHVYLMILTSDGPPPRLGKNFFLFLERLQGTLETLFLLGPRIMLESDFALPFRTFPKLTKLELVLLNDSFILALRAALSPIAQRLPALRSIRIYTSFWTHSELFLEHEDDQVPVETVTTLELGCVADFLQHPEVETIRRTVRQAAKMFPRVRSLTVPANLTLLTAIELEQVWGDVEKLTLVCGVVDNADTTLTGYSEEECVRFGKMRRRTRLLQSREREAERNISQFLKRVKVLAFKHGGNKVGCLTDAGCRLVLLKLANLRCLDLLNHKPDQVSLSEEVVREMQGKFQVVRKKAK